MLKFFKFKKAGKPATASRKEGKARKKKKKSVAREWGETILFAVIAASLIRWLILEPFTIPSSSMEKSLMVGDFLFVSKVNYGPRTPRTLLSFPLTHAHFPGSEVKSYLDWIQLPHGRLPGFQSPSNNDVIVFNYPEETDKPVDKREHYIKRCVAIAGDSLQIIDAEIFINHEPFEDHAGTKRRYFVETEGRSFPQRLFKELDITEWGSAGNPGKYRMHLNEHQKSVLTSLDYVRSIEPEIEPNGHFNPRVFPGYMALPWNNDNFGPLYIPARGDTIIMDVVNFHIYEKAIREHENNPSLTLEDGQVYLEGEPIDYYVFKMDYFFMIGDNRHNSLDSRNWGFVPEDHVVGKAVLLWLSIDRHWGGLRWERIFKRID
jgi:signal peptidase I